MKGRPDTGHTDSVARLQAAFAQFRVTFAQLEQLFGRRWESWVVVLLADSRTLWKAELTRMIIGASGRYCHPNQVTRVLHDLMNDGLVALYTDARGQSLYRLTQSGRDRARYLYRLAGVDYDDPSEQRVHDKGAVNPDTAGVRAHRQVADLASSPDVARFAEQWRRALILGGADPIQLTPGECSHVLRLLASDMVAAAAATTFERGRAIGANLLTAGFRSPCALGHTLTTVTTQLPPLLTLPAPEAVTRTTRLVEHIAIGFTRAMRDRALDEQETFQRIILNARYERAVPETATESNPENPGPSAKPLAAAKAAGPQPEMIRGGRRPRPRTSGSDLPASDSATKR